MRTTKEISEELNQTKKEVQRLNQILINDPEAKSRKYTYSNGEEHPEWSIHDAMTYYVAKKRVLMWVLNAN